MDRPKPSTAPVTIALAVLGLALILPVVIVNLPTIVVVLLALFWLSRRTGLGRGMSFGGRGQKEAKYVTVTTFRLGVPRPADPSVLDAEFSCRLVTRHADGGVGLAGGDQVAVSGWQGGSGTLQVRSLQVTATRAKLRSAPGATPGRIATLAAVTLAVAGLVLWTQRALLTQRQLDLEIAQLRGLFGQLLVILIIGFVTWTLIKKVILRR